MIRWFFSKTVREAVVVRKHVRHWMAAQHDLLSAQARGAVTLAMNELDAAIHGSANKGKIRLKTEELDFAANKWLKPYPHPVWRENVEVFLVAITVAMAIRTFFLQPFKIPTGSMQPTLYGVTSVPDFSSVFSSGKDNSQIQAAIDKQIQLQRALTIPTGWERIKQWFEGISYIHLVAKADGTFDRVGPMHRFLIFNIEQTVWIGGVAYHIWFPPGYGESSLEKRSELMLEHLFEPDHVFHKGDEIVKMRVHAGDHLFVDRLTYNFRPPKRGEIIVFETAGIPGLPQNEFYIKRLVGLGGDTLSIQQDYVVDDVPRYGSVPVGQLVVNGRVLSASTPHFANLYSFEGARPGQKVLEYHPDRYYGHAMLEALAPGDSFHVRPGHFFVMGDNTFDSSDSRYWGDFSRDKVIGKSFFVYWPITKRFGWGNE